MVFQQIFLDAFSQRERLLRFMVKGDEKELSRVAKTKQQHIKV